MDTSRAASTQRAYTSDRHRFSAWCSARGFETLPDPRAVAVFLSAEAEAGSALVTIGRRLAAIGWMHRRAGLQPPQAREGAAVILEIAGIRHSHGVAPHKKNAADADVLRNILRCITGDDLRGVRDCTLLAFGMAGTFRCSELVALRLDDTARACVLEAGIGWGDTFPSASRHCWKSWQHCMLRRLQWPRGFAMISVPWSGSMPFGMSDFEPDAKRRYTERAANALVRGEELRCCIRGCNRWIARRRRGVPAEYCPDHHISISTSPTYVFRDWRSNFIVNPAPISGMSKVETWRLGNESSEDALTWNVFVPLVHMDLLPALLERLDLDRTMPGVELYLWGNRILKTPGSKGFWEHLSRVREALERGRGFPTEPDIILRVPGRLLVLIEAKFGSSNATLFRKEDRFGGVDEFLARYPAAEGIEDPLDRRWIEEQAPEFVLEQLVRNVIFATHLAEKGERMIVLNLVRENDEITVESKFRKHLTPQGCVEFRRVTWESLFWPIFLRGGDSATPVLNYLANKSLGLGTAFPTLSSAP